MSFHHSWPLPGTQLSPSFTVLRVLWTYFISSPPTLLATVMLLILQMKNIKSPRDWILKSIYLDPVVEIAGPGEGCEERASCYLVTELIVIIQAITVVKICIPSCYLGTCTFINTKLKIMHKAMFLNHQKLTKY